MPDPNLCALPEVASNKISLLSLLAEVNKRHTTARRLEQIIETDVAIAYKLLRYINSAFFHLLKEVDSIHRALVYLGEREIRRFVTLVIISELAAAKPPELVRLSVVRARFCELLAEDCHQQESASELFLLGLFSLIDAILDTPMAQMMDKLPLSDGIKEALLNGQGPFAPFLDAAIAYEKGLTEECVHALNKLRANPEKMYDLYLEAIQFSSIID